MHCGAGGRPRPRRRARRLLQAGGLVGFLVAAALVVLPRLGDALVVGAAPAPADAVVVLGGGPRSRPPVAIALVQAGFAPVIYLLEDLVCPEWGQGGGAGGAAPAPCERLSAAQARGERTSLDGVLPRAAVVLLLPELPNGAAGTAEEAALAWPRLRARGARRLLLVTDEYHSRRATLVWRRAVAGEATIIPVPSVSDAAPLSSWWRRREARRVVLSEYAKLLVYALQGYL